MVEISLNNLDDCLISVSFADQVLNGIAFVLLARWKVEKRKFSSQKPTFSLSRNAFGVHTHTPSE